MSVLKAIAKIIDAINDKVGIVCSYISAPLMLLIVYEVVSRKLGHPTIWGYETIVGVYGWLILMTAAFGLLHDSIVKVDILSGGWSEKTQHIVGLITFIIFFIPYCTYLLPAIWKTFYVDFSTGAKSWSSWAPLIWPLKLCMPIGWGLLWLQGISEMIKHVLWLASGGKIDLNKERKAKKATEEDEAALAETSIEEAITEEVAVEGGKA